jgi:RNA ligase (TIGR02306 family)
MIKSVEIVKISKLTPIYKEGQEANSICVANFNFSNGNECAYNVIAQKSLYQIGDSAIYIQPDYCLSDIALFDSFTKPDGNPNKSKLGSNNRIRAIKFNFSFQDSSNPIYSFGILMPISEVKDFLGDNYDENNLDVLLGIHKWEEPEKAGSGLTQGDFPSFMYKTDEENQANLKTKISEICDGETDMGFSLKRDGSSITVYFKKDASGEWTWGVCSRTMEKKKDQYYVSKYVGENIILTKYLNQENGQKGWINNDTGTFYTQSEVDALVESGQVSEERTEVKDSWVELATTSGLVERGMKYCQDNNVQLAFRGEIFGQGLKGSGNKLNPDSKLKQSIIIFGIDSLDGGFSVRQHYGDAHNLKDVCESIQVPYTVSVVEKPKSYDEFCQICDDIIAQEKSAGRIIEGVVVRTHYSNKLSCKYMNSEYDAKK